MPLPLAHERIERNECETSNKNPAPNSQFGECVLNLKSHQRKTQQNDTVFLCPVSGTFFVLKLNHNNPFANVKPESSSSVDSFQTYVASLDSTDCLSRSVPVKTSNQNLDFDWNTKPEQQQYRQGQQSQQKSVVDSSFDGEIFSIDSNNNSTTADALSFSLGHFSDTDTENVAGGNKLKFSINSFMIWNDPDLVNDNEEQVFNNNTPVNANYNNNQQPNNTNDKLGKGDVINKCDTLSASETNQSPSPATITTTTTSPLSSSPPPQQTLAFETNSTQSLSKFFETANNLANNSSSVTGDQASGVVSSATANIHQVSHTSEPSPPSAMNVVMKKRGLFSRSAKANSSISSGADHSDVAQEAATNNVAVSTVKLTKSSNSVSGTTSATNSQHHLNSGNNSTSDQEEDRFNGDGVMFHGKLIGNEYVAEARGEQMCQQSLKKLKIIQKALGGHKRRIQLFISFDGIKIHDAVSLEQLFHHTVPQISFISRDETDTRAFGYVFGNSTTGHQFIGIKTKKEAMVVMSTIGQLFAITLKRKRTAEEAAALASATGTFPDSKSMLANDEHLYHSVPDVSGDLVVGESVGTLSTSSTTLNRSRRVRTTSSSSENVPIPALPPPVMADHRRNHHHHHHHHQAVGSSQQSKMAVELSMNHQNPGSQSGAMFADVFGSLDQNSVDQKSAFSSNLAISMDSSLNNKENTFVSGDNSRLASSSVASYEWANFDDDSGKVGNTFIPSGSGSNLDPNNGQMLDDSTLNTISSISDTNLSTSSNTISANNNANRTLSLNDSATLVARSNQKNAAKNSSSTTIASSNFDGIDPFSDAFNDDPFSAMSTTADISTSFATSASGVRPPSSLSNQNNFNSSNGAKSFTNLKANSQDLGTGSVPTLANQFNSLSLDKSTTSFKSNVDLSCSFNSTSSADRYAALADIHSLSTSIFDSFGNKKPSGDQQRTNKASNESQFKTQTSSSNKQPFAGQSFGSFSSSSNQVPMTFQTNPVTSSTFVSQFGAPPNTNPVPNSTFASQYCPQPISTIPSGQPSVAQWSNVGGGNVGGMVMSNFSTPYAVTTGQAITSSLFQTTTTAESVPKSDTKTIPAFQELDPLAKNRLSSNQTGENRSMFNDPKTQTMRFMSQDSFSSSSSPLSFTQNPIPIDSSSTYSRNCSTPSSLHRGSPLLQSTTPSLAKSVTQINDTGDVFGVTSTPPPPTIPLSDNSIFSSTITTAVTTVTSTSYEAADDSVSKPSPMNSMILNEQENVSDAVLTTATTTSIASQPSVVEYSADHTTKPEPKWDDQTVTSTEDTSDTADVHSTIPNDTPHKEVVVVSKNAAIAKSETSSVSSLASSLLNVSTTNELKFETSFDDVFESEVLPKNEANCSEEISTQDQSEVEATNNDDHCQPAKSTGDDIGLVGVSTTRSSIFNNRSLSRQSSSGSKDLANSQSSSTPPAVPPRTDLLSSQSGSKFQSRPAPPPPPASYPPKPSSQKTSTPPLPPGHYHHQMGAPPPPSLPPPSYSQYSSYPTGPYPHDIYADPATLRRYSSPSRYAPSPYAWNSTYEYLYHGDSPAAPHHYQRSQLENYPPMHLHLPPAPPPPPSHHYPPNPYADYYHAHHHRQSPYSSAIYHQGYGAPVPPPPDQPLYGPWMAGSEPYYCSPVSHSAHHHSSALLQPQSSHAATSKTSSTSSTPPPMGDLNTPPPPPLPNPQRRISGPMFQDRYAAMPARTNPNQTGMSNAEQSSLANNGAVAHASPVPNYPPPLPSAAYYQAQPYGGQMSPAQALYDYPVGMDQSKRPTNEDKNESDLLLQLASQVPQANSSHNTQQSSQMGGGFVAFNSNMEQMMLRYHRNSPLGVGQEMTLPGYHLAAQYQSSNPNANKKHNSATSLDTNTPNTGPSNNSCNSVSSNSSGSSGYSTMARAITPNSANVNMFPPPVNPGMYSNSPSVGYRYPLPPPSMPPFNLYQSEMPHTVPPVQSTVTGSDEDKTWPVGGGGPNEKSDNATNAVKPAQSLFDDNFSSLVFETVNDDHQEKEQAHKSNITESNVSLGSKDTNNNDSVAVDEDNLLDSDQVLKQIDHSKTSSINDSSTALAVGGDSSELNSPPERNIFIEKDDPFEDDFFKN